MTFGSRSFVLGLFMGGLTLSSAGLAAAQTVVTANNEVYTCSEPYHGDNEFWGSGPTTVVRLDLAIGNNGSVVVGIQMVQVENGGDQSAGYANHIEVLWPAQVGKHVSDIWAPNAQGVWGWRPFVYGQPFTQYIQYVDTNVTRDVFNNPAWWIESVSVNGDRIGADLFPNCTAQPAGTGSGIYFKPQKLTLRVVPN